MGPDFTSVYARATRLACRELDGEFVIVPALEAPGEEHITYYTLNEVARAVWERLDGKTTLGEIGEALEEVYEVEKEALERDMFQLLSHMEEKGLVSKLS